ncbi:MAG: ATP-binding protein [Desulfonauticus sp.]|nr:ATP-binding protein [Desulfonauticus sp.]
MLIKEFRGVDFINRDREIEFFLNYFKQNPERILWVYGPKSTGKTTLIEYIIENNLLKDKSYNVKYISLRRKMIANYDNFIDAFIKPESEHNFFKDVKLTVDLKFIKIDSKLYERIKQKEYDFFEAMEDQFWDLSKSKKNILIIDEIQTLKEIYMDGGKLLLNEFLNFCISLTKELHVSHVLILTSNTIFLSEIYNNAKMKVTSDFKLIDHLGYEDIKTWLISKKDLGFRGEDIELIYEYLGGSMAHIKKLLDFRKEHDSLQEQLEEMVEIAENEIDFFIQTSKLSREDIDKFKFVAKQIIENGYFNNKRYKGYIDIVSKFTEVEILFFDPIKNITTANNRIYEKAFERL